MRVEPYHEEDYDERHPQYANAPSMKHDFPDGVRIMPYGTIVLREKNFADLTYEDVRKAGLLVFRAPRTILAKDRPLSDR